jgi:hypothetical protein
MYGKKFVAAVLFLAVADIEVDAYGHYGGYGGYGGEVETAETADFDPVPAPESSDDGYTVDFPADGDWEFESAMISLCEIDSEEIDAWAADVPQDYTQYIPTDYVLEVRLYRTGSTDSDAYGVGLAHESMDEGLVAFMDETSGDAEFKSYLYDVAASKDADFESRPDFYLDSDQTNDPEGLGNTWGQMLMDDEWCIYNYNDDASDDWDEGTYHFFYTEMSESMGTYSGFEQDIDVSLPTRAQQLVAAMTAASLLLAVF